MSAKYTVHLAHCGGDFFLLSVITANGAATCIVQYICLTIQLSLTFVSPSI